MRPRAAIAAAVLVVAALAVVAPLPPVGILATPRAIAAAEAASGATLAVGHAGRSRIFTDPDLQAMAQGETAPSCQGRQTGARRQGALLWAVLQQAGAVEADRHRDHARLVVTFTGRDGYSAVIAMGEIDPAFEGKPVILARGEGPQEGHWRLIVPGDCHGGRSVRDVVRIAVP